MLSILAQIVAIVNLTRRKIMPEYTLSCENENCPWEEDQEFESRMQAEEAVK